MSSDRIIADGIKMAQDLLRQNLPPTHNLTDAAVVLRFRELVHSQAIRSALERSSDTVLAFCVARGRRTLRSIAALVAELRRPCAYLAWQRSRRFFAPGSRAILGSRFPLAATQSRK